jgi:DNA helicase HerA-like ATPase
MQSNRSPSCGREAGFIVGETTPLEFTFVSSRELLPPRLEYLVVPNVEEKGSGDATLNGAAGIVVDILAQVVEIGIGSEVLSESLTYSETQAILRGSYAPQPKMYGRARVIGYLANGVVRVPRCAAIPGSMVYIAPDTLLQQFFSVDVTAGVPIGALINRPNVPVLLDPNGQIIMQLTNPDDQRAVQRASEAISAELLGDLPGLNKGEAVVLGQLTRIPVMVRVTGRASAEGGSDVDIVAELRRAKQDVGASRLAAQVRNQPVVSRQQEEW